jgi:outer membrane lipoprotein SlyB
MKKVFLTSAILMSLALTACETSSQNVYDYREAGQSVIVEFGTVVDVRPIKIKGPNSGAGAVAGAVAGGAIGSNVGAGDGRGAAIIVGAIAGLAAGGLAEQALQDKVGRDFTIVLQNGKTITVPQYFKKDEPLIKNGERVMVQTSGSYQRVLPAEHLPETIKRPKGIKVVD